MMQSHASDRSRSQCPRHPYLAAAVVPWLALGLLACVGVHEPPVGDPPPNADPLLGCSGSCHGDQDSIAPPRDTTGQTDSSLRTIGAHRSHLAPAPTWYRKLSCSDCHLVPGSPGDAGHMDTPAPAELAFGTLATTGGVAPAWDGTTCSNVYCHGATLQGGTNSQPTWTITDGSQAACGSCHAFPPPAPHPDAADCGTCHPTVQPGSMEFLDPDSHINGQVDLNVDGAQGGACDSCHGSGGIAAPPTDTAGNTERTFAGVGAHREHIGESDWHRQLYCSQCHVVPVNVGDPTHIDATEGAEITFDPLNPTAVYDAATNTCQNLYCHGNGRQQNGTMQWNVADATLGCGSCHEDGSRNGETLSGKHKKHIEKNYDCVECHAAVVDQQMNVVDPELHVNGVHDILMPTGGAWDAPNHRCTNLSCHENEDW